MITELNENNNNTNNSSNNQQTGLTKVCEDISAVSAIGPYTFLRLVSEMRV